MSLTLQQATTIVEAALRKGRETACAPLAVAVLDAGGHLKAFAREDGAGIIRPQIAVGKAWGALGMGFGSRTLARRVAEQPQQQAFFGALNAMSDGRGRDLGRRVGQGRGLCPDRHRGGCAGGRSRDVTPPPPFAWPRWRWLRPLRSVAHDRSAGDRRAAPGRSGRSALLLSAP
jgi:hypothetical protein